MSKSEFGKCNLKGKPFEVSIKTNERVLARDFHGFILRTMVHDDHFVAGAQ